MRRVEQTRRRGERSSKVGRHGQGLAHDPWRDRPHRRRDPASAQPARAAGGRGRHRSRSSCRCRSTSPRASARSPSGLSAANAGLGPFPTEAIRSVFQEIFSACLSLEKTVRVAYLGPEGTFSHMAVKRQFGMSARATPIGTIPGVFEEVERGNADVGVVPIENTTEGVVNHTLDSFMESDLKISAEIALEVTMCLLARAGTELAQIERVYSIPIAAAQVRRWLATNLPRAALVEIALDRRGGAPGARRRARRRGRVGDGGQAARSAGLAPKHPGPVAQHDPLPGAGPPAGRADRTRQDVDPDRDARRAGHPLPHAGRVRRARAQHDEDREPPVAPPPLGVRLLPGHRRPPARRRRGRRDRRRQAGLRVAQGPGLVSQGRARRRA